MMNNQPDQAFPRWIIVVPLVALLALAAGGAWFYRTLGMAARQEAEQALTSIAWLKADQIAAWRRERMSDAAVLMEDPWLAEVSARYLAGQNDHAAREILKRFRSLATYYHYVDILLVDPEGRVRLRLGGRDEVCGGYAAALAEALHERKPVFTQLHTEAQYPTPHIGVVAPVFTSEGQYSRPIGAIVLIRDPSRFLYPLIRSWPTPSRTAETILVRRDGNDALFLNDVRHRPDAALKLRIPLSRTDAPSVMAVLGRKDLIEGKDYRGVEVVAVILPVPDSPWFMVAQMHASEAFAKWRSQSVVILALLLGAIALTIAAGLVLWQWQRKRHYRALYLSESALRASAKRHSVTLKAISDAVIATDARGLVQLVNPAAEAVTGWKNEEARDKPLEEIFRIVSEESGRRVEDPVAKVLREGKVVGLANHTLLIARDGRQIPIADSGAPIRDEAGEISGVVLVFRDHSAERAAREALRESEARYRRFFEQDLTGDYESTPEGRLLDCNAAFAGILGFESVEAALAADMSCVYRTAGDRQRFLERLQRERVLNNMGFFSRICG